MERKRNRVAIEDDASDESLSDAQEYMGGPFSAAPSARAAIVRENNAGSCESASDAKQGTESDEFTDKVIVVISNGKAPDFHFSHLNVYNYRKRPRKMRKLNSNNRNRSEEL